METITEQSDSQALQEKTAELADLKEKAAELEAFNQSQAIIRFKPDGTIIDANANFLNAMGYSLPEIQGKHHRMFVEPSEASSPDYAEFWARLGRGEHESRVFKRIRKNGAPIWIHATYYPVCDEHGKPFRVVKYATDVTPLVETAAWPMACSHGAGRGRSG